jgi:hypothetical protein
MDTSNQIAMLLNHTQPPDRHRRPSILFVQAVNFELTYHCNMSCSHCLQQGLRRTNNGKWISTNVAKKAIFDAHAAGLTKIGVNFTGGEIFLPESNLPELLEAVKSLNLNVRVNTNGWWGNRKNIRVGKFTFPSPGHVVGWLRDMNVAVLALSFDRRFEDRAELWHSTVAVIRECEHQGQLYQIIMTGVTPEKMMEGWRRLTEDAGIQPRHLIPVPMEMIDIGGASAPAEEPLELEEFEKSIHQLQCQGKGFYRPVYLHISPDGGVRSCLYAPAAGWLGNIYRESLLQIADRFTGNCVVQAISSGDLSALTRTLIKPYAHLYRSLKHPCAVAAVLSKAIEHYHRFINNHNRDPSNKEQRRIHQEISQQLGLNKETDAMPQN